MRNQTQLERVECLFNNNELTTEIHQGLGYEPLSREETVEVFADIRRGYCDRVGSDYAGLPDIWVCNMPAFMVAKPTRLWDNIDDVLTIPRPTAIAVEPRYYTNLTEFTNDMVNFFVDNRYQNQEVFLYTIVKQHENFLSGAILNQRGFRYVVRLKKMVWGDDNSEKVWLKNVLKRHKFGTTN